MNEMLNYRAGLPTKGLHTVQTPDDAGTKMTNIDWLKTLSADEFADWLAQKLAKEHDDFDFGAWVIMRNGIRARMLNWLEEEHREDFG